MKYLFLTLIPFISIAQTYSTVETVDSLSKDKLFSLASAWYANYYKSSQHVIQLSDREGGKIIGKALFSYNIGALTKPSEVHYTITTIIKDGKYKMEITDFYHTGETSNYKYSGGSLALDKPECGTMKISMKQWNKIKELAKEYSEMAIMDFKKFVATESKKEDF